MKVYTGDRTIDGIVVMVDDEPLDDHTSTKRYSRNGFEWSYEGPEPSQLAYAMLVDHLGNAQAAAVLQDQFMRVVVANFQNEWEMTSDDIDRALCTIQASEAVSLETTGAQGEQGRIR